MDIIKTITREFSLQEWQVENTVKLLDDPLYCPVPERGPRHTG